MGAFEDDEIVIAGISGRFPDCDNLKEFWDRLLNGDMLVTRDNRRWDPGKRVDRFHSLMYIQEWKATLFGVIRFRNAQWGHAGYPRQLAMGTR